MVAVTIKGFLEITATDQFKFPGTINTWAECFPPFPLTSNTDVYVTQQKKLGIVNKTEVTKFQHNTSDNWISMASFALLGQPLALILAFIYYI